MVQDMSFDVRQPGVEILAWETVIFWMHHLTSVKCSYYSWHLYNIHYVPDIFKRCLHLLAHLIFTTPLQDSDYYYHSHVTDEQHEAEIQCLSQGHPAI